MNKQNIEERFLHLSLLGRGLISLNAVAGSLGLSVRQAQRLLRTLKGSNWNAAALLPKTRGGWNKREDLRDRAIALHNQRPQRSNPAIQYLLNAQGIKASNSTIRRVRIEAGLYREKGKIEKQYFKKFEAKRFGDLVQMDTTEGYWLCGQKVKLILIIDDYSRMILGFKWAEHDTTWNNMVALRQMVEQYGLPGIVYTDNDSKFRTIRHEGSRYFNYKEEDYETAIKRALRESGIALVNHPPYAAFCKGKIERLFRFIQDRFLPETEAKTIKELSCEFSKWVDWYNIEHTNRMTGCKPKERLQPNGFKPLSGKEDLDYIFSLRKKRKIDKYNAFSFNGKQYFLGCKEILHGCEVTLALNPTHRIKVYYNDRFIKRFELN